MVITVKNHIDDLKRAVASVADQAELPAELIIVDDGSDCAFSVESLDAGALATRLTILRNDVSQGAAIARNLGAAAAHSEIVAFLDADDALAPEYIRKVRVTWQDKQDSICVATGFYWCNLHLRPYRKQCVGGAVTRERLLKEGNFIGGASVMSVNRERFLEAGGFPVVDGSQDWALLLVLAERGTIRTLPEPLVLYQSPIFSTKSLTSHYRRQILSLGKIARSLRAMDDQKAITDVRYLLTVRHLLNGGRRRLARRLIGGLWVRSAARPFLALQIALTFGLGSHHYNNLQTVYARLRSVLFSSFYGCRA